MRATDLENDARELLGYGWKTRFANTFGVNYATVKRWTAKHGGTPVPPWVPPVLKLLRATPMERWPDTLLSAPQRTKVAAEAAGLLKRGRQSLPPRAPAPV